MHIFAMNYRECDPKGCGHYGASRGTRKHNGVDMACPPETKVQSPVRGYVTKLGHPYADDLSYRYVQITAEKYRFRLFYLEPSVSVGDVVELGGEIGTSQGLGEKHGASITEHVHLEIMDEHGGYVDPTPVIVALSSTLGRTVV